jgi:hypothetical protein
VAVGTGGTIQTSIDGTVWTLRTSGTTQRLNDVAYGLGVYIAVGEGGVLYVQRMELPGRLSM